MVVAVVVAVVVAAAVVVTVVAAAVVAGLVAAVMAVTIGKGAEMRRMRDRQDAQLTECTIDRIYD